MPEHVASFIGKALVPMAVYAAIALARRYLPASAEPPRTKLSVEDLSARFRTKRWIVTTGMVLVGISFASSTHAILVWLNRYNSVSQSPEGLRLWPQTAIWWFFPVFGSFTFSWELTLLLWGAFGDREEVELYDYWNSLKAGFNCTRGLRWMALLIALPVGVLTALAIPMHATLRQNDILDCGYAFTPCQTYRYNEARRMTQVEGFRSRDGKLNARAAIIVDFKDGRRWSSGAWGNFSRSVDPELIAFLESSTGLQLGHAATEKDIDSGRLQGN